MPRYDDPYRAYVNERRTKALVWWALGVAALVAVPSLVLALTVGSGESAGIGVIFAIIFTTPVAVGSVIALLGLPLRERPVGPVLAGVGLGVNVLAILGILLFLQ